LGQRYIDEIAREWRAIHLSFVIDLCAARLMTNGGRKGTKG